MRNVRLQYLIACFSGLIPAYAIERLFWESRGVHATGAVGCEVIYAIVLILLEVPSGILADKFGRKRLTVVAYSLCSLEFIVLLLSNNFFGFALAMVITGVGHAALSGSLNALVYDSLVLEERESDFEKILGRVNTIYFVAVSLSAILGGLIAQYSSYEVTYVISFIGMSGAFICSNFLEEVKIQGESEEVQSVLEYGKEGLVFFKNRPILFYYVIMGAFLSATLIYLEEFWQLALYEIDVKISYFGMILTGYCLIKVLGNLLAASIKKRWDYRSIYFGSLMIYALGFVSLYFCRNLSFLVGLFVLSFIDGVLEPITKGYIHHESESYIRATVESWQSLAVRVIAIFTGAIFSIFTTNFNVFIGFLSLGILCLVYCLSAVLRMSLKRNLEK